MRKDQSVTPVLEARTENAHRGRPGSGSAEGHVGSQASRDCQLDLLRAVAILMVVAYHLIQTSPVRPPPTVRFWRAGEYGVDLFFVLSGWLIGGLYWKERARFGNVNLPRFWARRWLRTIPPYLAALAVTWLAVFFERRQPFDWGYLVFIQNYYPQMPYFLVSWSLCIEEHFYLFLPLLLALFAGAKGSRALLFSSFILAAPICRWLLSVGGAPPPFGVEFTATHLRLEGLLLGFWAAWLPHFGGALWPLVRRASVWAMILAFAVLAVIVAFPAVWMYRVGLSTMALGMASTLVWLVGRKPGRIAASRPIHAIALSSYSLYLTHALMLHGARRVLSTFPRLPWVAYFPIALGLIAAAGAAFYFAFERTSILVRDQWIPRRSAA